MSWVTGPHPAQERSFNVQVGTRVVLLVNGRPHPVIFTPGRAGGLSNLVGDRRIPAFGELARLIFKSASDITPRSTADIRLADGADITVKAVLEVSPAWEADDRLLLTWVERFGGNAAAINEAAQRALDADFTALMRSNLGPLSHDRVHAVPDKRSLVRADGKASGLLRIDRVHNIEVSEDPKARLARDTLREAQIVAQAEAEAEQLRFVLTQKLDVLRQEHAGTLAQVRARGEVATDWIRSLGNAEIHAATATAYGLSPVDIAYPEVYKDRERIIASTVRSVLTDNADVLPILADLGDSNPVEFLSRMFSTASAPRTNRGDSSRSSTSPASPFQLAGTWPIDPTVPGLLSRLGVTDNLMGGTTLQTRTTSQTVAVVNAGGDRVFGNIDNFIGSQALIVQQRETHQQTIVAALNLLEVWADALFDYLPLQLGRGTDGRTTDMTIDINRIDYKTEQSPQIAPMAIAGWVMSINALAAATTPKVVVRVKGMS